jgi:hypothetical protein
MSMQIKDLWSQGYNSLVRTTKYPDSAFMNFLQNFNPLHKLKRKLQGKLLRTVVHMIYRDVRNVALLLVEAHKMYQTRALSLNSVLTAIVKTSPNKNADLTLALVHAEAAKVRQYADRIVVLQASQVVQALSGSAGFLESPHLYSSRKFSV